MRLLIIDNYDSFTFNIKHLCQPYVSEIYVCRNDQISIDSVSQYDKIIISPGPGLPEDSGICLDVIKKFYKSKPILGVCLGAQAIALLFGGQIYNLKKIMHGKKSMINIINPQSCIYNNVKNKISVGRYHSWAIDLSLSSCLDVTSVDESDVVMSFQHKKYPLIGIQYHPESVLTDFGDLILKNWVTN